MAVAVKKYNPGFLSDQEIIDSFCVRTAEFDSLVESLRESDGSSSPHSLVIGPRGSGKTHLLLRVAAEARRDPALAGLFPIVFAEESYEVTSCGEFWLECLGRMAEQAPSEERDNLRLTHDDLRTVTDDKSLADRCIGSLLDFADRHQTRLLLLVENLNMLFADIDDPEVGWRLRQTLQTEPRIILFGTATSRFDEIDNPEHALYDLFRVITLRPLDTAECQVLWQIVAQMPSTTRAVRPLEILTGGNPRLLTIIARFGAGRSFRDLMENLLDLVDEHTEYFKSHLESLPPQERRVYLALARLWKPSATREVADLARLKTNTCSSLLKRLVQRGTVAIEGGTTRRRQYYLTERLYNIYYLLRRGVGSDRLVRALIEFMICLYSPRELGTILESLYKEHRASSVFSSNIAALLTGALINEAQSLTEKGMADEALRLYEEVIQRSRSDPGTTMEHQLVTALLGKTALLSNLGRSHQVISACDDFLGRFGGRSDEFLATLLPYALWCKGTALRRARDPLKSLEVFNDGLAYIDATDVPVPDFIVAPLMQSKGLSLLDCDRPAEALAAFDQVVARFGTASDPVVTATTTFALTCKAGILDETDQSISEAEFVMLLNCLAKDAELLDGSLDAIVPFVASVEPAKALDLLTASGAAHLLLPLITALQQELGQTPQVAKEVAEVASDVRTKLAEARARHAQIRAQSHAS